MILRCASLVGIVKLDTRESLGNPYERCRCAYRSLLCENDVDFCFVFFLPQDVAKLIIK